MQEHDLKHLERFTLEVRKERPSGPMDKASDYESEECRFESCQGRFLSTTIVSSFASRISWQLMFRKPVNYYTLTINVPVVIWRKTKSF
jgi:hypothetical protein